MDYSDGARNLRNMLSLLEPEQVVSRVMGYVLFQSYTEADMIRLANGPEHSLRSLINNALIFSPAHAPPPTTASQPVSPTINHHHRLSKVQFTPTCSPPLTATSQPVSPTINHRHRLSEIQFTPACAPPLTATSPPVSPTINHRRRLSEVQLTGLPQSPLSMSALSNTSWDTHLESPEYNRICKMDNVSNGLNGGCNRDFRSKICQYYVKGICRYGQKCWNVHTTDIGDNLRSLSLERLSNEIIELLRSRRGNPVSIATLPMLYKERYRKDLEAEGYLTESQRHDIAVYTLTTLLTQLHSIRIIDKCMSNGQHSVVLAKDTYEYRGKGNDLGPIVENSRQIYITFRPESSFTKEDVAKHFRDYGTVRDVRIPEWKYGYVEFESVETAKALVAGTYEHIICGFPVHVKPYRAKLYNGKECVQNLESKPELRGSSEFCTRQPTEHAPAREDVSQYSFFSNTNSLSLGCSMDQPQISQDQFPLNGSRNRLINMIHNVGSSSGSNNSTDQDSNKETNRPHT